MKIDRFEVQGELGRGGMGTVYRAWDPGLDRQVAIKRVTAGSAMSPQEFLRFQREAQVVARIRHPNVVPVHSLGVHEGRPYYVMDLVEGETLQQRLKKGPLPPAEAATLVTALGGALEVAHGVGVLHRDLKPANVLIRARDGAPLLTDFGLAKDLCDTRDRLTCTGEILGTPDFMPPEQIDSKRGSATVASDVYGLGATAYAALTGRPPFSSPSAYTTLNAVLADDPTPPSKLNPQVPADLEAIVLRCLQKEPAHRYASVTALVADVRRFERGAPIRAKARRTLSPSLALALSLVGLALSAALLYGVQPGPSAPGAKPAPPPTAPLPAAAPTDAVEGRSGPQFFAHPGCVAAAFVDDRSLLTAGSRTLRYWRRPSTGGAWALHGEHALSAGVRSLLLTPKRDRALLGLQGGGVQFADSSPPFTTHNLPGGTGPRFGLPEAPALLAYDPNGDTPIVAAAFGSTLHVNWLESTTGLKGTPRAFQAQVSALRFVDQRSLLVGYGSEGVSINGVQLFTTNGDGVLPVVGSSDFMRPTALLPVRSGRDGHWVGDAIGSIVRAGPQLKPLYPLDGDLRRLADSSPLSVAHPAPVRALARLSDGRLLSVAGHDREVDRRSPEGPTKPGLGDGLRQWSADGFLLADHRHPNPKDVDLAGLDVSPDESQLALLLAGQGAEVWTTPQVPSPSGLPDELSLLHTQALKGCCGLAIPNHRTLLSAGRDGVRRWVIGPGGSLSPGKPLTTTQATALALHGGRVFVGSNDGHVDALRLSDGASVLSAPLFVKGADQKRSKAIQLMTFNAAGTEIAVAINGLVARFELPSGKPKGAVIRAPNAVMAMGYDQPSGRLLIAHGQRSSTDEGEHGVLLVEPSGEVARDGFISRVNAILPAPEGGWWIGDQAQVVAHVVDVREKTFEARLADKAHHYSGRLPATRTPSHDCPVRFLASLPGGRLLSLASRGDGESEVHIWDRTGRLVADHHNAKAESPPWYARTAVSPCGRLFAAVDNLNVGFQVWSLPPPPR